MLSSLKNYIVLWLFCFFIYLITMETWKMNIGKLEPLVYVSWHILLLQAILLKILNLVQNVLLQQLEHSLIEDSTTLNPKLDENQSYLICIGTLSWKGCSRLGKPWFCSSLMQEDRIKYSRKQRTNEYQIANLNISICHLPKKNLWAHRCSLLRSIHWSSQRIFSEDLPCMKHGCILQVRGGKEGVHEMKIEWGRIVYLMLYLHNTKEFLFSWTVIYSGKKIILKIRLKWMLSNIISWIVLACLKSEISFYLTD